MDSALDVNPDLIGALLARAQLHRRDGQSDEAMDCLRRALRLDPTSVEARNMKNVVVAAKAGRQTFRKDQSGLIKKILRFLRHKPE